MSAEVEGSISLMDLTARKIATKTGYWSDDWVELTLMNYLS